MDEADTSETVVTGNGAVDPLTQSDDELVEAVLRGESDGSLTAAEREAIEAEPLEPESIDAAPVEAEPGRHDQRRAVRHEARRVRRVVRKIDPWSVLKVSVIFYLCLYVILIVASVLLWSAAVSSGTVDNVEDFVKDLGFTDVDLLGGQMFRAILFGGAIMIVVATGFTVLIAILFNMISDLVGGVRVTMIEQEIDRPVALEEEASPSQEADSVSSRPGAIAQSG